MNPTRTLARALVVLLTATAGLSATAGQIVSDTMKSEALGGMTMRMNVYLPDGYNESNGKYPVLYLLHGASGDEHDWTRLGGVAVTLDALIKRGVIRPSIAVMPSIGPQSWFADGAVHKMETALINELLPHVESRFKASGARADRGIAGLSMGGYGALNLSLKHPSKFCAAGVISPAIYDPLPPETSAARRAPQLMRDGKFDPELWKQLNYPSHVEKYAQQTQRVPMWIVSGDHDALGIAVMSANLYSRMLKVQPKQAELRIVDGDHEWAVFRDALPDALQYVDRQCKAAG
jgi:enterochelin esterase-like enzyme